MKTTFTKTAAALAVVLLSANAAVGSTSQRVGAYDFSYVTSGSQRATPVQVFDDGKSTYFQFRAGEAVPAIFARAGGALQLLVPQHEGPYIKVPQVHGQFTLQLGRAQAMVIHSAGTRLDAPSLRQIDTNGMSNAFTGGTVRPGERLVASLAPVAPSLIDDALERNSYATPVRGDRMEWVDPQVRTTDHTIWFPKGSSTLGPKGRKLIASIAASAQKGARVEVVGRDDETLKEGLDQARANAMRDALVKAGVPLDSIATKVGVAGKQDKSLWESNVRVEVEVSRAPSRPTNGQPGAGTAQENVQALVRSGVLTLAQGNAILHRQGASGTPSAAASAHQEVPPGGFRMIASDKTVQATVRRWAAATNHTIVWEVPSELDAQVGGDAVIPAASLKEAVERLVAGLRQAGYALDATFYSNRVIRFTPAAAAQQSQKAAPTPSTPNTGQGAGKRQDPAAQEISAQPATTGVFGGDEQGRKWSMRTDDRSVEQMLSRWGQGANWSVVWNAKDSVPIGGDALVEQPSFLTAADYVMAQAVNAGYRLKAVAYANNTLVVSSY
ncbi:MAG: TcpQ domain-containing protein [Hydrogenophaga sp.]|uniref:TcpQ domain-containing protein n=1 Tax=Hydrogenophaga sp. TaxID=1904254 RepID=UPI002602587D|nr:TcpQ domain-containing protein [Hydrogenophaga sp.]MCV0438996.1 TcpQ domain-containing protein [Hydrogenophaga sp.]